MIAADDVGIERGEGEGFGEGDGEGEEEGARYLGEESRRWDDDEGSTSDAELPIGQ